MDRYLKLYPDKEKIKKAIRLQVVARINPKGIKVPDAFKPKTQLDRFVFDNMEKAKNEKVA